MKRFLRAAIILSLACAAVWGAAAQSMLDRATGHSGGVTDMVFDAARELLITAGEDGSIRVWDAPRARLLAVLQVSYQPIQKVVVHPSLPHVAALVGGTVLGGEVVVWDWEQRTRLYDLEFKEQLLSIQYSPAGGYLVVTRADFDSLTLLDPRTGRSLLYMRKGFGIVSFAVVSRNENNIMTYQPSGVITYWDIKSGRTLKQVRTVPNLGHVALSPNYRFAAGTDGDKLAVVDLLTGETIDERQVSGLTALAFSPQGNELTGIVQDETGPQLHQWYFGGRFLLQLTPSWMSALPGQPQAVVYGSSRVYAGMRDGSVAALRADGSVELVAQNRLLHYSDAAVLGDTIALADADRIYLLESSFLTDTVATAPGGGPLEPAPVRVRSLANPLGARGGRMASSLGAAAAGPDSTATLGTSAGEARTPTRLVTTGLEFLNPGTLLLWTRGDDRPVVGVLDIDSGIFQPLGLDLSAPLKQVGVFPRGIVIVDESGACLILDLFSFRPRFRYRSPGMNKLVFAVGDTLVGGRASLSTFGSPLLQINERTGETVAISDPGLFVYDLAFEPREASLYTLSVDNRSTPGRTILKAHSGYGFERSRILSEYRGEDLGASLAKDAAGRIYSSLGYERVLVWDGQDVDKLEDARKIHRGLFTTGEKVVAVNRDGSLSFWETRRGQLLLTLYVLQDLGWLAVLPDGSTYTPPD